MKAELDVGNNIASLLERLAQQIGTTADKVFPWYVQQAYVEGVTTLCAIAVLLVVSITTLALSFKKADFDEGNRYAVVVVVSSVVLLFSTGGAVFEGTEAVRKIINPNYYAMSMLTRHVERLVHK